MKTFNAWWLVLALVGVGCGPAEEAPGDLDPEELELLSQGLGARSPSDRVIVWQQNIEAMKAAAARPSRLTTAALAWTYRPDILVLQEAWQRVLCGDYLNPAAAGDVDLNNFRGSTRDARGLSKTCRLGRGPLPGSLLHRLGSTLWGSAANAAHRRPFNDNLGSQSRTGTTVIWDQSRFVLEDDFEYDDSDVPGCSTVLESYKRIAVLLRDTRRTADLGDDRLIAIASAHYGSACMSSNNQYVAEQMVGRWGTFGGRPLSLRMIGGDFNARVDETSATYSDRRREETPGSWYSRVTTNTTWRGKKFLDPVVARHGGGAGEGAALCAQWTYPNVSSCALKTACSATCSGFGIGGKLDRLDYLFVSDGQGTLDRARILSAETDDQSAGFSDHKAVRVSLRVN